MQVALRDPADQAELERGAATRRDPKLRDRFRAVLLAIDGKEAVEIAQQIHRSRRFVQNWVYRYRDGGTAALKDKPRAGKACKLSVEEQQRFRQRILDGPLEADGLACTLRGPEAKRILQREFGKSYALGAVYKLMHRLGLSPLRPATRHPKSDPAALEKWLADAPFLYSR
jgi:transposase